MQPYNPNPYQPPGGPYQQPMGAPYGGGQEYEFDQAQNAVISWAALWARILGIVLIVIGALSLINCNVIGFALDLVVGIFFIGGGGSLASVVNTQGNDVAHMMQAMSKLRTSFKIRVIATLVAVGLVLALFGLAFVFFVLFAASSR